MIAITILLKEVNRKVLVLARATSQTHTQIELEASNRLKELITKFAEDNIKEYQSGTLFVKDYEVPNASGNDQKPG